MKQEWRYFRLAISYFTRIPAPVAPDFQAADLNHAAKYLPLAGILVGGAAAVCYMAAKLIFPTDIAVVLSMLTGIFLTGCLHEDGLADTMDGLGGGWSKEQILAIMQDSRLGSYGATALSMILLMKFLTLSHMPEQLAPAALITAHGLSRFAALLVMKTQTYVREQGKAKPLTAPLSNQDLLIAGWFGLAPLALIPWRLLPALLPAAAVWLLFSLQLKNRLGGYTGDTLGAMQQLTEISFYLGLLAWS
ncbi:MAG: adenosylcobinamide-GDP ribazoletransferase [Methylomonas sp.]|jgi:adenosylcobinamide-GDP ribazoletransferase